MVTVQADDPQIRALERYLYGIENGELEMAADQFTADAEYYHPPMHEGQRGIKGRDAIHEFFVKRGSPDIDHELEEALSGDGVSIILGSLLGSDIVGGEDVFIAYAEFEGERMSYYYTISPQFLREGYYTNE